MNCAKRLLEPRGPAGPREAMVTGLVWSSEIDGGESGGEDEGTEAIKDCDRATD